MQFYIGLFSVFGSAAEHEVLFFSRGAALWIQSIIIFIIKVGAKTGLITKTEVKNG